MFGEKRVSSFVNKGNKLIADGKTKEAVHEVEKGLNYYTEQIMRSITPYATEDTGLLIIALRQLTKELEKEAWAKDFADELTKNLTVPQLDTKTKFKKSNKKIK